MNEVHDHLEQIVRPNMTDLADACGDVRRAFNAIAAVDALAGHIWHWCRANAVHEIEEIRDDSEYRRRLSQKNVDYALVRDMAKAQKHIHLTRGSPQVSNADQVETRSLGWGEASWDEGLWGSPPQVVVDMDDGEMRVVEPVLSRAITFLEAEMARFETAATSETG
jgi:hypothetical protein